MKEKEFCAYRSVIVSCLKGFRDGPSFSRFSVLSRLKCRSFFLKLLPAWFLPIGVSSVPFESSIWTPSQGFSSLLDHQVCISCGHHFWAQNHYLSCPLCWAGSYSMRSVEEDLMLCSVRALKWFLDRTKAKRSFTSLFVLSFEPFKTFSKAPVSRWLVKCISMAGPEALFLDSISSPWNQVCYFFLGSLQRCRFKGFLAGGLLVFP